MFSLDFTIKKPNKPDWKGVHFQVGNRGTYVASFASNVMYGKAVKIERCLLQINRREVMMNLTEMDIKGSAFYSMQTDAFLTGQISYQDQGAPVRAIVEYVVNNMKYNITSDANIMDFLALFSGLILALLINFNHKLLNLNQ